MAFSYFVKIITLFPLCCPPPWTTFLLRKRCVAFSYFVKWRLGFRYAAPHPHWTNFLLRKCCTAFSYFVDYEIVFHIFSGIQDIVASVRRCAKAGKPIESGIMKGERPPIFMPTEWSLLVREGEKDLSKYPHLDEVLWISASLTVDWWMDHVIFAF